MNGQTARFRKDGSTFPANSPPFPKEQHVDEDEYEALAE